MVATTAPKREETRKKILDAAERLFAERGLDGVTVHEIHVASGQKNKAAVNYHFGGKPELVRALLTRRVSAIERRINEMLDELTTAQQGPPLRALMATSVNAWAETLDERWGPQFARLLNHVSIDGQELLVAVFGERVDTAEKRLMRLVGPLVGHLTGAILVERMSLIDVLVVNAIAKRAGAMRKRVRARELMPLDQFAANLVDATVGVLEAPVSPAARGARRRKDPRSS